MALGIRQFVKGLRLVPEGSTTIDTLGELQVNSSATKIAFHNGTTASYILTESHSATGSNRIQNKDLDDASVLFVDSSDTSKKLAFEVSGVDTATTRTMTVPNASGTLIISGGQPAAATLAIGTTSSQALALNTNNTTRITIESAGSVTIESGTLRGPSAAALSVTGQSGQDLNLNASGSLISAKTAMNLEAVLRANSANNAVATGADATATLPTTHIVRLTNASLTSLAGVGAGAAGQHLVLINDTTVDITVRNQGSGASASDRIITGTSADITMKNGAALFLVYETSNSRWRVIGGAGGSSLIAPLSKTANYTITTADETILADSSGGAFTLTLPSAASIAGQKFFIKKTDSSANGVIIDGNGSQTIDGQLTFTLASQYDSITIVSDGSNWHII